MLLAERAGRKLERRSNSAPRGMAVIAVIRKGRRRNKIRPIGLLHFEFAVTMTNYILALDQGTTSSRAILFDRQGQLCASAQQEYPQHFPQPGWVEHDPMDIWHSQLAVARQVLREHGVVASQVRAIGVTNQRETTVVWERASGRPIAPAIVWQDRRTADACERLRAEGRAPMILERTGLELDAYFSAT